MSTSYPKPTRAMAAEARNAAQAKADELGISIDCLCVVGTPEGVLDVIVLDEPTDEPVEDCEDDDDE